MKIKKAITFLVLLLLVACVDDSSSSSNLTGTNAPQIAVGATHMCARYSDSRVKCWGSNGSGQLGYGDTTERGVNESLGSIPFVDLSTTNKVQEVQAGANFSCALFDNAKLKCWGDNTSGKLGYGDTNNRGDGANEMGDQLPFIDFGQDKTVKEFSVGDSHSCVLLNDDTFKCWGDSTKGKLGKNDEVNHLGDAANEMGDNLTAIDLGDVVAKRIFAEGIYSCVITTDDRISCWGGGGQGALGFGVSRDIGNSGPNALPSNRQFMNIPSDFTPSEIDGAGFSSCVLFSNGEVYCSGLTDEGQTGFGATGPDQLSPISIDLGTNRTAKIIASASGGKTHCALLDNDTIKCWGRNDQGQLGIGNNLSQGNDPNEMGDFLQATSLGSGLTPKDLYMGTNNVCVIFTNNKAKCWGDNTNGQLGKGNSTGAGAGSDEMGDNLPFLEL